MLHIDLSSLSLSLFVPFNFIGVESKFCLCLYKFVYYRRVVQNFFVYNSLVKSRVLFVTFYLVLLISVVVTVMVINNL